MHREGCKPTRLRTYVNSMGTQRGRETTGPGKGKSMCVYVYVQARKRDKEDRVLTKTKRDEANTQAT